MLTVTCTSTGRANTRMWTEGKTYNATVCGHNSALLSVIDDLGHERFMGNEATPGFVMGTSHPYASRPYRATFVRNEDVP